MIGYLVASMALAAAPSAAARDRDLEIAVKSVSAPRLRARVEKLVSFGTRHTLSDTTSATRGIGAARRWLEAEMARAGGGRIEVEMHAFTAPAGPRVPSPTEVVNVLGWLRGTQEASKRRVIVVSGHYDSRVTDILDATSDAPGADDDASGVAVVLEAAEVLSRVPHDATLLFALVAGEEQGLLGSDALAARLASEGYEVEAMFTNDIVGASRGGGGARDAKRVRLFSEGLPESATDAERKSLVTTGGENDSASRNLARFARETAAAYVRGFDVALVFRRDRYLRGGDHLPFLRRGFAACRFTEPCEDFAHQHQDVRPADPGKGEEERGDLVKFCDFGYMAKVAAANVAVLGTLARAPARPREVGLVTDALGYDSALVWTRGVEPDLAGYRVHVRATTAPLWERAVAVGDVTAHTLVGVSKDDVVLGVSAVDRQGHASPAVFPLPRK